MITGTGPVAFAGVVSVNWMSTVTSGYDELSTWPTSRFVTTGTSPTFSFSVSVTSHFTFGRVLRHAAVDLAVEVLDDLRPPLFPLVGRGDLLAVLEDQRVGQVGIRVGLRLVEVGGVGRLGVAVRPAAELLIFSSSIIRL